MKIMKSNYNNMNIKMYSKPKMNSNLENMFLLCVERHNKTCTSFYPPIDLTRVHKAPPPEPGRV